MKTYYLSSISHFKKIDENKRYDERKKLSADLISNYEDLGIYNLKEFSYFAEDEPFNQVKHRAYVLLSAMKQYDMFIMSAPFDFNSEVYLNQIIDKAHDFFQARRVCIVKTLYSIDRDINRFVAGKKVSEWARIEKDLINKFEAVIVPTKSFAEYVRNQLGYQGNIVVQGAWGYRAEVQHNQQTQPKYSVTYIGHQDDIKGSQIKNIQILEPNDKQNYLIIDAFVDGKYGLIVSQDTFIDTDVQSDVQSIPFTLGIYVSASVPIIALEGTELGDLVSKHEIGWTVSNIEQVQSKVESIDNKEYMKKVKNTERLSGLFKSGYFEKQAIFNVVDSIYNNA